MSRTRYKVEIVDGVTDEALWDALVTEDPPQAVRIALADRGLGWRRATEGGRVSKVPLFGEGDPANSIRAAIEFADRRETKNGEVLRLLIKHVNRWVPRHAVRAVGGDSGDRRVRECRQANWPIETKQIGDKEAWHVRLHVAAVAAGDDYTQGELF